MIHKGQYSKNYFSVDLTFKLRLEVISQRKSFADE